MSEAAEHGMSFWRRMRDRPDSEHEQIVIRLAMAVTAFSYMAVPWLDHGLHDPRVFNPLIVTGVGIVYSLAFVLHLYLFPGISPARRITGIACDLSFLTAYLFYGEALTSPFLLGYLWITFANGFRFGVRYLFGSALMSIAGFATLMATNSYWGGEGYLGYGFMVAFLLLTFYVAELVRKLTEAKAQAEQANEAKSRFLATVSHELRTPLNAVIGLTDLLEGSSLDPDQRSMVHSIRTSGRALLEQINDILDLSKIESGRMDILRVPVDLHDLLADVYAIAGAQARSKELGFAVHADQRVPYALIGDKQRLREVLVNLTGNAIKFTESGEVVLSVAFHGEGMLRFAVTDTGVGIAQDQQERIFESFTQADDGEGRHFGGTGLGLTISRRLVTLMGGEIGVESTPGQGSTFWFTVPLEVDDSAPKRIDFQPEQVLLIASGERAKPLEREVRAAGAEPRILSSVPEALRTLADDAFTRVARPIVVVDEASIGPAGDRLAQTLAAGGAQRGPLFIIVLRDDGTAMTVDQARYLAAVSPRDEPKGLYRALRLAAHLTRESRGGTAFEADFAQPRRKLHVLLTEDNGVNRQVARKILERAGHSVVEARDGEAALDALEQEAFDVVLMDINMPGMSGIEATKLYRASAAGDGAPPVPVVALTADATPEARARCEEAGMDGLLVKPFEPAHLLEALDRLVPAAEGDEAAAEHEAAPAEPAWSETAQVTRHPRFADAKPEILDEDKLAALNAIGGREFVAAIAGEFVLDTAALVHAVNGAVERNDVREFRDALHALRSSAANMGAKRLFRLAHSMQGIDRAVLRAEGAAFTRELGAEYDATAAELQRRFGVEDSAESEKALRPA